MGKNKPNFTFTLEELYRQLLGSQEPLGVEFEKVLNDKLTELLARW